MHLLLFIHEIIVSILYNSHSHIHLYKQTIAQLHTSNDFVREAIIYIQSTGVIEIEL